MHAQRLRFVLLFSLLSVVFLGVYHFPYGVASWPHQALGLYLQAYTRLAGGVLVLFDPAVRVNGILIGGKFPLEIGPSCDAADAMALLTAAILAFPAPWTSRVVGLVLGTAGLFILNVIRICSLYFIGTIGVGQFDFAHHDLWPVVVIFAAGLLFLGWARWAQGRQLAA